MGGVLFGGTDPRIVQVADHHVDANPDGILLIMKNQDKPGVIGQAGTIFAKYNVNVGEWRMGRHAPGSEALSFISLDSEPPPEALQQLRDIEAVTDIELIVL